MLVVCKAWLRVATPLLYHIVILRSTAQAQALAAALKKNLELVLFIKKPRAEGRYSIAMHHILKISPNISDLVLSLQLYSSDSSAGLISGLPLINPKRVIVVDHGDNILKNQHVEGLVGAILDCVTDWNNLVRTFSALALLTNFGST
jgi:hypothetical protein